MRKYANRIAVICGLIIFFFTLYVVADTTHSRDRIKFGYWADFSKNLQRNFVILGTDKDETRTDLILLCNYDQEKNSLNVMQIPRDTFVKNSRSDKKINSAYGSKNGISTVKAEIESLTGIYPENYIVLNFKGFRELIDAIGGVEYTVPVNMSYSDPAQNLEIDLKKGYQVLNGEKAEMFMRFRQNNDGSGYAEGDIGRLKAHKSFYEATISKLLSLKGFSNLGGVISAVGDNLKTDFTLSDLMLNIKHLKKLNNESVNIIMLPGNGEYMEQNGTRISYYIVDNEKLYEITNEYF